MSPNDPMWFLLISTESYWFIILCFFIGESFSFMWLEGRFSTISFNSILENGLELILEGEITSVPYIKMTLALLNEIGVETSFIENKITVKNLSLISNPLSLVVESDWSSASYFYSIVALSTIGTEITLSSYKQNSLQGDSAIVEIFSRLGVQTVFLDKEPKLLYPINLFVNLLLK